MKKESFFRGLSTQIQILLFAGILIFANLIASQIYFRVDLTESGKFTVAPATTKLLEKLDDLVVVKTYFSPNLPVDLKTNLSYAADFLRELKSRAGGNLRIENVDVADSNGQNAARSAGIPQISVTVREKDELKAQNAFLGLGIFYHGKSEIFPVLTANEVANFQYNFAIAILKLTSENSAKKRIAIVENHSSFGENDFKNLRKSLEKIYAVEKISLENAENFDALLVFSPAEKFTENEKFLLEQKILGGTPALFFLDKLPDVTKADTPPSLNSIENGLDDFFENWGLEISNELIADVSMDRLSYSQGFMRVMTSYPLFPLVTENTGGLNLNHPTTAGLGQVSLKWPAAIEISKKENVETAKLLSSTEKAWKVAPPFSIDPSNVPRGAERGKFDFAVFATAQNLPAKFKKPTDLEFENPIETGAGKIFVVSNGHFLRGSFLDLNGAEMQFFQNAVDFLALDESLISIRAQKDVSRPLDKIVDADGRVPEAAKFWMKFFNLFLLPAGIVGTGIFVYFRRKNLA